MRAIRVLKEADMVLAEDTRTSSVLLKHFDIKNRLVAHHKFNEHGTSAGIVERLKAGETIALISDAGHRVVRITLRQILLRGIHPAEEGQTNLSGITQG